MDSRGGDRVGEANVDIAAWLHGLGLQQYEQAFRQNAIDDAVLVYFGYPEAHEDDAERAVRAGLAVIDAVGGLATPSRTFNFSGVTRPPTASITASPARTARSASSSCASG